MSKVKLPADLRVHIREREMATVIVPGVNLTPCNARHIHVSIQLGDGEEWYGKLVRYNPERKRCWEYE